MRDENVSTRFFQDEILNYILQKENKRVRALQSEYPRIAPSYINSYYAHLFISNFYLNSINLYIICTFYIEIVEKEIE